jgi:hypothetical protein
VKIVISKINIFLCVPLFEQGLLSLYDKATHNLSQWAKIMNVIFVTSMFWNINKMSHVSKTLYHNL